MKYIKRQRLLEGRREKMELEDAVKFFKEHCTQYNPKLTTIYRGIKGADYLHDYYNVIKPSEYIRSAGHSNTTYLNIIDNSESWKNYPKRRKSIICSTSRDVAHFYGEVHVVIPVNNSNFDVCPDYDFQKCFDNFNIKFGTPIYRVDEMFDSNKEGYSYEDFKRMMISNEYNPVEFSFDYRQYVSENNLTGEDIYNEMIENISPTNNGFKTFRYNGSRDISTLNDIRLLDSNEVWTSDDCLLITETRYKGFLEAVGFIEEED